MMIAQLNLILGSMNVAIDIQKELEKIGKTRDAEIKLLKWNTRYQGVQLLEPFFDDLFITNPKLTHVYVMGYTPGWNDGEECFHTTQVHIYNDVDGWGELGEFLECKLNWDIDYDNPSSEFMAVNAGLSKSKCRDIEDLLPVDAMSSAFGTDWLVIATRDGVTIQEFDIGY